MITISKSVLLLLTKVFLQARSKLNSQKGLILHFLTQIKRNNVRISDNDMLSFDGVLNGIETHVVFHYTQLLDGKQGNCYKSRAGTAYKPFRTYSGSEIKPFNGIRIGET